MMLTEFDYAYAEEFFATNYEPLVMLVFGTPRVLCSMLYNPSEDAAEDDLESLR